jgi:hypothetical protein
MSDEGTGQNESNMDGNEQETSGTTSAAGDDFTPIISQQELDQAIKTRLERERAKFKDYNDLKAKAAEFDKVAEAQKTDLQRQVERAEAAEKEAAALRSAQEVAGWKAQVSKKFGIPADVLRGATLDDIEDHAASLKALLPEPRTPGFVQGEGRTVTGGAGNPAQQFANLIKQQLS